MSRERSQEVVEAETSWRWKWTLLPPLADGTMVVVSRPVAVCEGILTKFPLSLVCFHCPESQATYWSLCLALSVLLDPRTCDAPTSTSRDPAWKTETGGALGFIPVLLLPVHLFSSDKVFQVLKT